jgi:peroxiredoxin
VPRLVEVQEEHGGDEFTVVGVMRGGTDEGREFARELGTTYPILTGGGEVFDRWGVTWVPQSYLIDPDGNVVEAELDEIEARLSAAL